MYWLATLILALCIIYGFAIGAVCPLLSHLLIHLLYTLHCKLYNNNNNNNNNRFHILSHQPPHLAFFQVLLCTPAFFLSLGSDMLLHFWGGSCLLAKHNMLLYHHRAIQPTQHLLYLQFEFGSMVYISRSVHVKFAVEHSAAFGSSCAPGSLYQVNKLPSLQCSHNECSILDGPTTLWKCKLFLVISIGIDHDNSSDRVPALLYVH